MIATLGAAGILFASQATVPVTTAATSPPQCVNVRLMEPKAGTEVPLWLIICGEGSADPSPLKMQMNGKTIIADGEYLDPYNCIKEHPCYIFGYTKP